MGGIERCSVRTPGSFGKFPTPWVDGCVMGDIEIVPIKRARELYEEARLMGNCASGYAPRVSEGDCYLYSVRKNSERIAMVELRRGPNGLRIGQFRGRSNNEPPNEARDAVMKWCAQMNIGWENDLSPQEIPWEENNAAIELTVGLGCDEEWVGIDPDDDSEPDDCDWDDEEFAFALFSDDEYLGDEFPEEDQFKSV